jgi:2-polyprenyl-6-methoxyphenol hydroxylase-like FAD-dependent oxidoreductase
MEPTNVLARCDDAPDDAPYDVAVVGYGPVGQALSAMLGAQGHRVAVVERWPQLFPLPRAGHVDHEIMRVLQSLGVADQIAQDSYEWQGLQFVAADGEVLRSLPWGYEGASGWHSDYSLFQPYLESLLHGQAARHPSVDAFRGWQVESLEQESAGVRVAIRQAESADNGNWVPSDVTRTLCARYVVGCDGANSVVRQATGIPMTDFGFEADWLVVFVQPDDPTAVVGMPDVAQILDPARPTTAFRSSGKRFCRWEFMLMPGETPADMSRPEVAWKLIERWGLTPANSKLVRNTVFRFRSMVADRWRSDRAFLAGDAAHLMPPFLGQGLCSGLRDAKNLAWKLDLVLRGLSPETLLDTYEQERQQHSAAVVRASLSVGELIMVTDPVAAEERNDRLRSSAAEPAGPLPPLTDGILLRNEDGSGAEHAGELAVQPRISLAGRSGRSDDVLGNRWTVLTTGWDARPVLSSQSLVVLDALGAVVMRVEDDEQVGDVAVDLGGTFTSWARGMAGDAAAVIIRPDFYTFAVVGQPDELDEAVRQLGRQLGLVAGTVERRAAGLVTPA